MLTLELSTYLSEILNDAYETVGQIRLLFNTQSRVQPADWFILENHN